MSFGHLDNLVADGTLFGSFVGIDVRDPRIIDSLRGANVVYHFAGIAALPVCQADPTLAYDVNTSGTAQVLEAARRAEVGRVVFSSTSAVYERNTKLPQSPGDDVAPDLVYALTKRSAEELCRAYAVNYGMDIITCRFFNVYGPHQDMRRKSPPFTSYVARELVAGRQPILFNNTSARRDYVHADDVIDLLVLMGSADGRFAADVYNVGSGVSYSVPELYAHLAVLAGSTVEAEYRDPDTFWNSYPELFQGAGLSLDRLRKEVLKESLADIHKTAEQFGWNPSITIQDGLRSVIEYAQAYLGTVR